MNIRTISAIALVAIGFVAAPVQAQIVPAPAPPQVYQQGCPPRVTPSAQVLYGRYMRRFGPLGLVPAQQQRIESLVDGFAQTHPAGSPLDPAAMHQLR
ncbi:MAG: hypothetical protein JOY69_08515, partial [Candidatus Eremiobacteraeota bacterium]|nr:hypothetical protein [Candidatus Eremiobacteraeota bacterium]